VLCADEMTGLQAVSRLHRGSRTAAGRRPRYEFEYERHGTLCYTALLNVFTGWVFGRTTSGNSIVSFETALEHCLGQPACADAERIFLILDNGSAHHPSTSPERL